MSEAILKVTQALVARTFGDDAQIIEACLRTLRGSATEAAKWLAVTRAVGKAREPEKLLRLLTDLAEPQS